MRRRSRYRLPLLGVVRQCRTTRESLNEVGVRWGACADKRTIFNPLVASFSVSLGLPFHFHVDYHAFPSSIRIAFLASVLTIPEDIHEVFTL